MGAFYVKDVGLNRFNRRLSNSFRELNSLFLIYRNNGAVYQRTTMRPSDKSNTQTRLIQVSKIPKITDRVNTVVENPKNRIILMGSVYIYYDQTIYEGSFDEFSIEEISEKPFSLDYSFKFTVRYKYYLDNRTTTMYNQNIIETGKITNNIGHVKNVVGTAQNIQTTSRTIELSTSAPPDFPKEFTLATLPNQLASWSALYLEKNNYPTTPADKIALQSSFEKRDGTYAKDLEVKNELKSINKDIIIRQEPDLEKADRDADGFSIKEMEQAIKREQEFKRKQQG
jgi:hypothetical protein